MRLLPAIALACAVLYVLAASAQDKVWTDAPVPGTIAAGTTPADRAGTTTTAGAPFSAQPSGLDPSRPATATMRDGSSPGADGLTPNLNR